MLKSLFVKIISSIADMKLKYKMLLSYSVLIIIPVFLLTGIVFNNCAAQRQIVKDFLIKFTKKPQKSARSRF